MLVLGGDFQLSFDPEREREREREAGKSGNNLGGRSPAPRMLAGATYPCIVICAQPWQLEYIPYILAIIEYCWRELFFPFTFSFFFGLRGVSGGKKSGLGQFGHSDKMILPRP